MLSQAGRIARAIGVARRTPHAFYARAISPMTSWPAPRRSHQIIVPPPIDVKIASPAGNITGGRVISLVAAADNCVSECTYTWSAMADGTPLASKTGLQANYTVGIGGSYEIDSTGRSFINITATVTAMDAANRTSTMPLQFWVSMASGSLAGVGTHGKLCEGVPDPRLHARLSTPLISSTLRTLAPLPAACSSTRGRPGPTCQWPARYNRRAWCSSTPPRLSAMRHLTPVLPVARRLATTHGELRWVRRL